MLLDKSEKPSKNKSIKENTRVLKLEMLNIWNVNYLIFSPKNFIQQNPNGCIQHTLENSLSIFIEQPLNTQAYLWNVILGKKWTIKPLVVFT